MRLGSLCSGVKCGDNEFAVLESWDDALIIVVELTVELAVGFTNGIVVVLSTAGYTDTVVGALLLDMYLPNESRVSSCLPFVDVMRCYATVLGHLPVIIT